VTKLWHDDPLLRWLRALSVISFLSLVILVVQTVLSRPEVNPNDFLALAGLLAGAVLLQLGYEVTIPGLVKRAGSKAEDKDDG
jgi:hypothetical protein